MVSEAYYGVDRVTSAFVVIITECFTLNINNMGVSLTSEDDELDPETKLTERQANRINTVRAHFESSRSMGNQFPNIDADVIWTIFECFGILVPKIDILANLDNFGRVQVI